MWWYLRKIKFIVHTVVAFNWEENWNNTMQEMITKVKNRELSGKVSYLSTLTILIGGIRQLNQRLCHKLHNSKNSQNLNFIQVMMNLVDLRRRLIMLHKAVFGILGQYFSPNDLILVEKRVEGYSQTWQAWLFKQTLSDSIRVWLQRYQNVRRLWEFIRRWNLESIDDSFRETS